MFVGCFTHWILSILLRIVFNNFDFVDGTKSTTYANEAGKEIKRAPEMTNLYNLCIMKAKLSLRWIVSQLWLFFFVRSIKEPYNCPMDHQAHRVKCAVFFRMQMHIYTAGAGLGMGTCATSVLVTRAIKQIVTLEFISIRPDSVQIIIQLVFGVSFPEDEQRPIPSVLPSPPGKIYLPSTTNKKNKKFWFTIKFVCPRIV